MLIVYIIIMLYFVLFMYCYNVSAKLSASSCGRSTVNINIGYTPILRDSCYLDPEGEAQGMLNSMNPDK